MYWVSDPSLLMLSAFNKFSLIKILLYLFTLKLGLSMISISFS